MSHVRALAITTIATLSAIAAGCGPRAPAASPRVLPATASSTIVLAGVVRDPAGAPVAGAEVSLLGPTALRAHQASDAAGRFSFTAPPGTWALSAHVGSRPDTFGGFLEETMFRDDRTDVVITLGAGPGVSVEAPVVGIAPGTFVLVTRYSEVSGDQFAVQVDAAGRLAARLPPADRYGVEGLEAEQLVHGVLTREGDRATGEVRAIDLGDPPAGVMAWLAEAAAPLTSVLPGQGFDDLAPFAAMIGSARVVGLGEATHGTREFFQLKHRLIEYLVARLGFTVVAFEGSAAHARATNDYVMGRTDDLAAALNGFFAVYQTEEVVALLDWLRAWNLDPDHLNKVTFAGFDMQQPAAALAHLEAVLTKVAPALVAHVPGLAEGDGGEAPAILAEALARHRTAWTRQLGREEVRDALHDLTLLAQFREFFRIGRDFVAGNAMRDRAMAQNVEWLLAESPPGTRIALWAHNAHVGFELYGQASMGHHLRRSLGADYYALGLTFGQGSFQATEVEGAVMREFTVGPPVPGALALPLAATSPMLLVDLRTATSPAAARWAAAPHLVRGAGAWYQPSPFGYDAIEIPADLYDGLAFVDRTTRARPLPGVASDLP